MISKRIPMNSAKKSSFAGLVNYITNSQGINERVGDVRISNCVSEELDWAVREALATQRLNTRAEGDKTYHLLISFAPGERPSKEVLQDVEDTLCSAIGFGEHQRVSAVHGDTEALHIHVAINKIHPTRHTMHEPYRDFKVRSKACAELEIKHGLQRVDHSPIRSLSESKAQDMERHAGIESLVSWVRSECLEQMQAAQSWGQLRGVLAEHGLLLKQRGTGFVLATAEGVAVKASTVSRELSRGQLEKRLGSYDVPERAARKNLAKVAHLPTARPGIGRVGSRPPPFRKGRHQGLVNVASLSLRPARRYAPRPMGVSTLFSRYMDSQAAVRHEKQSSLGSLRAARDTAITQAKNRASIKRNAIKLTRANALARRALYQAAHKTLGAEIEKAKREFAQGVERLNATHRTRQWKDWLQAKAKAGDGAALEALRRQRWAEGIRGDAVKGTGQTLPSSVTPVKQHVTKEGTLIYSFGRSSIRDDGKKLQVSTGADDAGIEAALRMAAARYGSHITVDGSDHFKELVAQTAARRNLPITFHDASLQKRREQLQQSIEKGLHDERNDPRRPEQRRAAGNSAERFGRARTERSRVSSRDGAGGRPGGSSGVERATPRVSGPRPISLQSGGQTYNKPGVGRVGGSPPAKSKNRLRNLSQLGVVQFADRSSVLLPSAVPQLVDNKGTQPDHGMRRDVPRGGRVVRDGGEGPQAAMTYVAERENKRSIGFDIPKHRLYTSADEGAAVFAGIRRVDGEHLALLQRHDEVLVLTVDEATARRLQRRKLGAPVTANSEGVIKTRGRTR